MQKSKWEKKSLSENKIETKDKEWLVVLAYTLRSFEQFVKDIRVRALSSFVQQCPLNTSTLR